MIGISRLSQKESDIEWGDTLVVELDRIAERVPPIGSDKRTVLSINRQVVLGLTRPSATIPGRAAAVCAKKHRRNGYR